jgi:hypothetical protein
MTTAVTNLELESILLSQRVMAFTRQSNEALILELENGVTIETRIYAVREPCVNVENFDPRKYL